MFAVELELEDDGRWIAEVPRLPGVMVYGATRQEAVAKVEALALRVLADRPENGEPRLGCLTGNRLDRKTANGFAPNSFARRLG